MFQVEIDFKRDTILHEINSFIYISRNSNFKTENDRKINFNLEKIGKIKNEIHDIRIKCFQSC